MTAADTGELVRERDIRFAAPVTPEAVGEIASLLAEADGIEATEVLPGLGLRVRYDLRRVSLEIIEDALAELGFVPDASLSARLARALVYYTEDNRRATLGSEQDLPHATRDAFVSAWRERDHGCRDHRPAHWRRYW